MKVIKTIWTGIRPLLMHNGWLADPTNPYSKVMREITAKGSRKLTESDYLQRDQLEWRGSIYWDEQCGPVVPSDNIERCIQLGAQKSRRGKDIQAVVFCTEPFIKLEYDGPRNQAKLIEDPRFSLRKGVCIKKVRISRVRPMFPTGWRLRFECEYDDTIINGQMVFKAMQDAGALIGLGDWRPKFGRFIAEEVV